MRVSISLTNYSWPDGLAPSLGRVVEAADRAGLDTVWVADHLVQADPTAPPDDTEMLEAYTTLDVLTGGRAWLGIGAGHQRDEAAAMGLPFPPAAERFERLEETLQIADRMWAGDETPFEGRRYRLGRPQGSPGPAGHARPPVLIGGAGERRTLRLVARYADACNLFDIPDGGRTVRHKLEVLARHCEELGRPCEAIEKTLSTRLEVGEPAEEFVRRSVAAAALGIEHMVVISSRPWTAEGLSTLAAAVPALREVGR
ncbi:MAG TPA: LLM class flavin-dependent oxidoreductase [Actinomycetota bacterium]|nr:LLM class flavin-dependent oxidoreductase [Actinomycetota bacterium]